MGSLLNANDFSDAEWSVIETLPRPSALGSVLTTNVWVVEWLSPLDRHTGRDLYEWMECRRPGWATYRACNTKEDLIHAIDLARRHALSHGSAPILHIESHGCETGLARSSGENAELLSWDELTIPLQKLNLATQCNLIVVFAACVGFGGIQAFCQGPRAPAVVLVGPDANLMPSELLAGTKEFYRRCSDTNPALADIVESASREMGTVHFKYEPFATFCYEAMIGNLVKSIRPSEQLARIYKRKQRLLTETELSPSEIDFRLIQFPLIDPWENLQKIWDEMFMIDIDPGNKQRFGLNMKTIVERLDEARYLGQI